MIVVDASVAVQWIVPEIDGQDDAESVLGADDLVAPDLLLVEVASALRRKVVDGEAIEDQCLAGIANVARTIRTEPVSGSIARRAFELALELSHSVYDCIYVAYAEDRQARLVTRDQQLAGRLRRLGFDHLLADLPLQRSQSE